MGTDEKSLELLKNAGLYRDGCILVHEPALIERYNNCLKNIGVSPTALTEFYIDGAGYSLEIACEKANPDYLSHDGISNPYAVLISPLQKGLTFDHPYYSFYRPVMESVFKTFYRQINDITLYTGICINFEEGLSHISSPGDLLLMEGIVLKFEAAGLIVGAAMRQRELVSLFRKDDNWGDQLLIDELQKNIRDYGDLRDTRMQLTDLPFMDVRTFYADAFGGMYVFRNGNSPPVLVLAKGNATHPSNEHLEYRFDDPMLYDNLLERSIIERNPKYWQEQEGLAKLKRMAEYMLVDAISAKDGAIDIVSMSQGQRTLLADELIESEEISPLYKELCSLIHRIELGQAVSLRGASEELQKLLMRPHKSVSEYAHEVIFRFIAQLMPYDVLDLYTYSQQNFFELFCVWPKNKQLWAIDFLKKYYGKTTVRKTRKTTIK